MNILLISSIYPLPSADNQGTKVCHYFAKECIKQGHSVQVIHIQAVYPQPLYWIAGLLKSFIAFNLLSIKIYNFALLKTVVGRLTSASLLL